MCVCTCVTLLETYLVIDAAVTTLCGTNKSNNKPKTLLCQLRNSSPFILMVNSDLKELKIIAVGKTVGCDWKSASLVEHPLGNMHQYCCMLKSWCF